MGDAEGAEDVKDSDAEVVGNSRDFNAETKGTEAEGIRDTGKEGTEKIELTGTENAGNTKKTKLPDTTEFPKDTRRKKKAQPAGSLPEGSAAIHSILTSVVAAADGIPGEINVKI